MRRVGVLGLLLFIAGCTAHMDHASHEHVSADNPLFAELEVGALVAGEEAPLTFHLRDHHDMPLGNLITHHGRQVHVLITGEDLATMGHIHPEDFAGEITEEMMETGAYPVKFTFPKAGTYLVAIDIMNAESALAKQFVVEVAGSEKLGTSKTDFSRVKYFKSVAEESHDVYTLPYSLAALQASGTDSYRVSFSAPSTIIAGEEFSIQYFFEQNGEPVTDFEQYLNAPMHVAIVRDGFDGFLHWHGGPPGSMDQADTHGEHSVHGEEGRDHGESGNMEDIHHGKDAVMDHGGVVPGVFGPVLEARFSLPKAGTYQVFSQVKHHGEIVWSAFMIEVEDAT